MKSNCYSKDKKPEGHENLPNRQSRGAKRCVEDRSLVRCGNRVENGMRQWSDEPKREMKVVIKNGEEIGVRMKSKMSSVKTSRDAK